MKKEELQKEWDCLLLIYEGLSWQGKIVARKRMNEIKKQLKH